MFLFSFWELPQIVTITLLRMSNCLYMEWFPATNFHIKSCHNSDNYLLSKGDKKSLKVTYHSDFFTPPPTPNLLNPNILAPMVQGFELRDLQFKAGSINDNYREFILLLLQNCSLFIGDWPGRIPFLRDYPWWKSLLTSCFSWPATRVDGLTTGWGYGCPRGFS